jgi:hypothetical protein
MNRLRRHGSQAGRRRSANRAGGRTGRPQTITLRTSATQRRLTGHDKAGRETKSTKKKRARKQSKQKSLGSQRDTKQERLQMLKKRAFDERRVGGRDAQKRAFDETQRGEIKKH